MKYCAFLHHCEKSAQVTYVNVRSQRGLFLFLELRAKSRLKTTYVNVRSQRGLFLFLELRAKSRLKTTAEARVFCGNCFCGVGSDFFIKIILRSRVFLIVLKCCRRGVLRFLRHSEKSAQVTYVNVRSQRGLFLFLELRTKSRLKTTAGLGVLGEFFLC